MTCAEILDRLSAGLDGELMPPEAADVRRHLESCAACGRRSELLRQTRAAFRTASRRRSLFPLAVAAISGMLALAVVTGVGRLRGGSESPVPKTAGKAAPAASDGVARARRVVHAERAVGAERTGALDTIDCGLPGAVECVVDMPCADRDCGPQSLSLVIP